MSFTDKQSNDMITQPYVGVPLQFSVDTGVAISWNDIIGDASELPPVSNVLHEISPSTSMAQQVPFHHQLRTVPIIWPSPESLNRLTPMPGPSQGKSKTFYNKINIGFPRRFSLF